jgi:hypothetical protein
LIPSVAAALAVAMLWMAAEHVRASSFAAPVDPAIIGLDRNLAAALACGLAALGVLIPRLRTAVAVMVLLGGLYALSAARVAGQFGAGEIGLAVIIAAALFLAWPRLEPVRDE